MASRRQGLRDANVSFYFSERKTYVEYIEKAIGCHIGYISVGPERDAYIKR